MIQVETIDGESPVHVLHMRSGENRFHPDFIGEFNAALDKVEASGSPAALVTTGEGKFYSNGLDLDYLGGPGADRVDDYLHDVLRLIARVLTFPAYTVAACNGHAFGAGAQLLVAHDLRLMRADRGWFCMPEIDMKVSLHPGMVAILQARVPAATLHEVLVTGRRYAAEDARATGIVDEVASEAELLERARAAAALQAGKAHKAMAALKRGLYARVLEAVERRLGDAAS